MGATCILIATIFTVVTQVTLQQRYYYSSSRGMPRQTYFDRLRFAICSPPIYPAYGHAQPRGIFSSTGKILGNIADGAGKTMGTIGKSIGDTLAVVGKSADAGINNFIYGTVRTIEKGVSKLADLSDLVQIAAEELLL